MRGSLRLRLLLSLTVVLLCGTLLQGLLAYRGARAAADDQFDYQMEQLAISIAQGLPPTQEPHATRLASDIRNFDFIVQVWTIAGLRLFATEPRILIPPDTPNGLVDWQAPNGHYRIATLREPGRVIQVAQDQAIRARLAGQFAWRAIAPAALWAPLVLLVGLWLVNRALRPLRRVREQVAQRRADDLAPLDDSALPNEIRPVISEFNALLARLAAAFDAQGRFVADAAHELRTPLAALKLQVQALGRQVAEGAPGGLPLSSGTAPPSAPQTALQTAPQASPPSQALRLAVARVSDGIDRAARLVEQLLLLAREAHLQQGGGPGSFPLVMLNTVASDTVEALSDLAVARGIDLGLAEATAVEIRGDPDALGILARNLVDNAIKYSPRGGTVDLRVEADAASARLIVEDAGPGVEAEELAHLFDRFRRGGDGGGGSGARGGGGGRGGGDSTAADAERPDGSGLGLAIVKAIALRHEAGISAERSTRLGGLKITISFARAGPQPSPAGAAGRGD